MWMKQHNGKPDEGKKWGGGKGGKSQSPGKKKKDFGKTQETADVSNLNTKTCFEKSKKGGGRKKRKRHWGGRNFGKERTERRER